MFKLLHNCPNLKHQQNNAQNSLSQASIVCELLYVLYVQARFRKDRGTREKLPSKKQEDTRKTSASILLITLKHVQIYCVDLKQTKNLWKILQEIGISDHLTCFLTNLCSGQEATVRTRYEMTDWFQIGREYIKAAYCHPVYLIYMVISVQLLSRV